MKEPDMEESEHSEKSEREEQQIGMRITSDPDRTDIEQPRTFGAREKSSLPFRILLVSDLLPELPSPDWSEGRYVHRIDKNSFSDFMARLAPELTLEVPNAITDAPKTWELKMSFSSIKAFEPVLVAKQVEPLSSLREIRDLVEQASVGKIDIETFQNRLSAIGADEDSLSEFVRPLLGIDKPSGSETPAEEEEDGADESVDRILDMMDVGADEADRGSPPSTSNGDVGSSELIQALMDAVSDPETDQTVERSTADLVLDRLTRALSEQLRLIVKSPSFRKLEARWRGVKFLVDRIDFRKNIELAVLPAARSALHEAMHYQVILPEHDEQNEEPPYSLVLVDDAFGRQHRDIDYLKDLAGTGASIQTPVVTSVDAGFFGIKQIGGLARLPALRPHLQGDEYVEWESLREEDEAQFLGMALPSFLLRTPYEKDTLNMQEESGLLGNGALAVGAAAANSFASTGWPTHLQNHPIEDLPVQPVRGGSSPLECLLPGSKLSELARAGFIVLGGRPDRDMAQVVHASMVRRPETYDDPVASRRARKHESLPCRLFVSRAAHRLLTLKEEIEVTGSMDSIRNEVTSAMASFMGIPMPDQAGEKETEEEDSPDSETHAVSVEHVTNVDLPRHELFAVRLSPPDTALAADVRLVMGFQVPASE